jgi:hypothetical protein
MPEITEAQHAEYRRYQQFGTPDEVDGKVKEADKVKGENAALREKKRAAEAKVPPEGATVLTGDDAKRWDAYTALGKTPEELAAGVVLTADERKKWEAFNALDVKPEDIPAIVEENKALKEAGERRSWEDGVAAMAEAEGIPKESVPALSAILRSLDPKAAIEVKKEKSKDGAGAEVERKVGYVTFAGQQAAKFSDLRKDTAELKGIRTVTSDETKEPGNPWPAQETTGKTGPRSPEDHRRAVTAQLDYNV